MAEEVEMTPVAPAEVPPVTAAEPPKTNPLARPTATLKPGLRLPPKPGTATAQLKPGLKLPTQNALKPGIKLPPKPGTATAQLKPGLKLPTQTALKPGLKLPTQTAIKPGVRLPAKPVIRKPGATVAAMPLPKPVVPQKPADAVPAAAATPAPAAAATPAPAAAVTPAPAPVSTPEPAKAVTPEPAKAVSPAAPAPQPAEKPLAVDSQGVAKLPTVSAPAIPRDSTEQPQKVAEASKPLDALKSVTQKLKGITQEIPAQAILHKTGIIADGAMTDSQKEAAKHKTARISLSDAMGVAPVKSENAPIKTIRIKRPVGIGGASRPTTSLPPPVAAPEDASKKSDDAGTETAATVDTATAATQPAATPAPAAAPRKTLKLSRPGGPVRPTKFGIKRPATVAAPTKSNAPAPDGAAAKAPADGEGHVADVPEIAEIPDIAAGATAPAVKPASADSDGPAWLWTLSSLVQAAACVAIGALAWMLYQNTQTMYF